MAAEIPPFYVMEVVKAAEALACSGREVFHLEVGQPATPAPAGVLEAAERAVRADRLGYTPALGRQDLRERVAAHIDDWYGETVHPDRILISNGASGGFLTAFLTAFGPGARVAVAEPGYPCYRNTLLALGMEPVAVPVGPETRFHPTPEMLEQVLPLAGVIVASPANPTGTALSGGEILALASWCAQRSVRLISDEIYHGLIYQGDQITASSVMDDVIVLNSFSKYFSMTGWRLGWMVLPSDLASRAERLQQNLAICAPALSQIAACAAFDCHEELQGHLARYTTNREIVLDALASCGLTSLAPADGAFYVYADVSALGRPASDLCATWLNRLGVAVTPGIDFDPVRGEQFVRLSFAGATDEVSEGVHRLAGWISTRADHVG